MVIRADFDVNLGTDSKRRRKHDQGPLRYLVFAELSDQAHDSKEFFVHPVTVDGIDDLMRRLAPSFPDPGATGPGQSRVTLSSLEDFHPDALIRRVPGLKELADLHAALGDPARRDTASRRIAELTGGDPEAAASAVSSDAPNPAAEGVDQTLERLLGRPRDEAPSRAQQTVDALIKSALETAAQPSKTPQTESASQQLEALFGERLRAVLTGTAFRAHERAWRSLHWLVSRLEDDQARVFVIDIGKPALATHLSAHGGRLEQSPLHRVIVDDENGWDLLIGDFSFGLDAADIVTLAAIGALAARARAPFLAHGDLALAGCPSADAIDEPWNWSLPDGELAQLWTELRRHPASAWIGLAAPRFVLRYPYGQRNDPVDSLAFEELPQRPARARFLWANPAFACALLIGASHDDGTVEWPRRLGGDVPDLPTPLFDDGTGEAMQAPLEFLLGERARTTASQHGLIVFASGANTNRIATTAMPSLAAG